MSFGKRLANLSTSCKNLNENLKYFKPIIIRFEYKIAVKCKMSELTSKELTKGENALTKGDFKLLMNATGANACIDFIFDIIVPLLSNAPITKNAVVP
uniref:CSON006245 protein n=1 Tax=Culicoides sonorensis TaxID=179676 RepID=A0A336M023_CULSO